MKKQENIKLKRLIFILVFLLVCIIIAIISLLVAEKDDNNGVKEDIVDETENTIDDESNIIIEEDDQENVISDIWKDEINNTKYGEKTGLVKVNDAHTYFLIKKCMQRYYQDEIQYINFDIIDEEAKNVLNLNVENINNLYKGLNFPMFCIDEIYKQKIDSNKNVYVVYHRLEEASSKNANIVILVKVDELNKIFSIYPYEYLKLNNYLNVNESDEITISDEIAKNDNNTYNEKDISTDNLTYIKEFMERYKFDLFLDLEHLYNTLDDEYKTNRFKTFEGFMQYINENKEELDTDRVEKYQVNDFDEEDYIQFMGISNQNRHYIFHAKNIMEYKLLLDNYTTEIPQYTKIYKASFPTVQAKYCIDRVRKAINDKNYEFIYDKLDEGQKSDEFCEFTVYNDFVDYIKRAFFEQNTFEFEDYMILSENVYQYLVKVTDSTGVQFVFRRFDMKVTLKDDADFTISITQ